MTIEQAQRVRLGDIVLFAPGLGYPVIAIHREVDEVRGFTLDGGPGIVHANISYLKVQRTPQRIAGMEA